MLYKILKNSSFLRETQPAYIIIKDFHCKENPHKNELDQTEWAWAQRENS
jgi:hypothetical protein